MKNLDIEHLERKNIYKVPDESFFTEIQAKVLQETAPIKETKTVKLNWMYAAAAAMAMVFGATFVKKKKKKGESPYLCLPDGKSYGAKGFFSGRKNIENHGSELAQR